MASELFDKGLAIRKKVLGEDYVNRSLSQADEFTEDFQTLVTEYCWGSVWGRSGLDHKTRSMLNIAMVGALNRPHELKLHVHGALRNGVTPAEIREILMQVTIYAGVPAGVDSFRIAREAIDDFDKGN
jgi:4-carboxymuconolactone decarboxylase